MSKPSEDARETLADASDPAADELELARSDEASKLPPVRNTRAQGPVGAAGFHWAVLVVCSMTIAASVILDVRDVTAPFASIPLPGVCTFKRMTGLDCPGCGLTRCFVSLSHGRIWQAWEYNPAGLFLYGVAVFQIPYRIMQVRRLRQNRAEIDLGWAGPSFLGVTAILLILQWAIRLSMLL